MRIIELTISVEKMPLFGFLKSNPTQVWKNGEHYKFTYYEPVDEALTVFNTKTYMCLSKTKKRQ